MDNHNTTGNNFTYNHLSQNLNKHFGTTHTTGFRNPSLYELYGSDIWYSRECKLNPEKANQMKFL